MIAFIGAILGNICEYISSEKTSNHCVKVSSEAIVDASIYLRTFLPESLMVAEDALKNDFKAVGQDIENIVMSNVDVTIGNRCSIIREYILNAVCEQTAAFTRYDLSNMKNITWTDTGFEFRTGKSVRNIVTPMLAADQRLRIAVFDDESILKLDASHAPTNDQEISAISYICQNDFSRCVKNKHYIPF